MKINLISEDNVIQEQLNYENIFDKQRNCHKKQLNTNEKN